MIRHFQRTNWKCNITVQTSSVGSLYSVTKEGDLCSDIGMAELYDSSECQSAVQLIQNVLPDAHFFGSLLSSTVPKGCHYRLQQSNRLQQANLQENVYWNDHPSGSRCRFCRSICKGKSFNTIVQ